MSKRLTGLNPLAYMGVEPSMPPNMNMAPSSPTANDVQGFNLGDFWVNTATRTLYVLVSQQRGVATWIPLSSGAGSTTNFVTNSGTATEMGGAINVLGDGVNTNTSASGNTINVNLDTSLTLSNLKLTGIGIEGVVQTDASGNLFANNGTNGQVLIGGGTHPTWSTLTAGSNINIVNGANAITISASGAGGGGATTFITDVGGPATEIGGDITFRGGNNITTDGTLANTVTLNLTGTTNHALQVGNSSGSLTSLTAATNGQIPIGSTGANPVLATITAGSGITVTNGAGTITIGATGGGGGGSMIVTTYATPGSYTWTKGSNTKYVEVWGWCGGAGGGSGSALSLNNQGGAGGGSGSFFRFKGPTALFGTTATVVVGAGGTGGASVTSGVGNSGTAGGVSSFGNIIPPLCVNNGVANATIFTPLIQAGAGGSDPLQITPACGYSGGIFTDDAGLILNKGNSNFQYSAPVAGINPTPTLNGGGAGSFAVGANALSIGGFSPYGIPGRGSFGFMYMLGTSGGQGGSASGGNYYNGGTGGTIFGFDTTTVLAAGGTAGVAGGSTAGGNGTAQLTTGGLVVGGTGGGGGAADPNNGGTGGNGDIGAGGGGGGCATPGRPSGAGGNGGNGLVIVVEFA